MHVVRWIAEAIVWATVAATVAVLVTQAAGWTGSRLVAVGQALTPVLGAASLLAAILGRVWSNWPLTIAGAGSPWPVRPSSSRRRCAAGGRPRPAATTDRGAARQPAVREHPAQRCARRGGALPATPTCSPSASCTRRTSRRCSPTRTRPGYPHRVRRVRRRTPTAWRCGAGCPLADVEWVPMPIRPALLATVCLADGARRAHRPRPPEPADHRRAACATGSRRWTDCHVVATSPGPPTIIVADLNAARWHPPLRRLLARGWRDVHEAAGRRPAACRGRPPGGGRSRSSASTTPSSAPASTSSTVCDLTVPGSDHRGFVVTVALAPPPPADRPRERSRPWRRSRPSCSA